MIPPKVKLSGDESKAEKLRAFGLSQLQVLHRDMAFRGLQQNVRRVIFEDGTSVVVKSVFGLDEVNIFVPPAEVEEVEIAEEVEIEEAKVTLLGGRIGLRGGPASVVVCNPETIQPMTWSDRNPESMERSTHEPIRVDGGVSPYKWKVSGEGYWLDAAHSLKVLENVRGDVLGCSIELYADNTICGVARITVTDVCEQVVNGEVSYVKALEWFEANPTEMDRGTKLLLHITGGAAPYVWNVEGKGFWFDEEHILQEITTDNKWVHLYAEASSIVPIEIWPFHAGACPPANVTVRDDCDGEVAGEIGIVDIEELAWKDEVGSIAACTLGSVDLEWRGGVPPFWVVIDNYDQFSIQWPILPGQALRLDRDARVWVMVAACGEKTGVTITDTCGSKISGEIEVKRADTPIEWDYDNSDEEIDQSESGVPIVVTGGIGPYRWEVSPSDKFSLGTTETEGPTNTLSAAGDACGMCTITVTDCCGDECTGSVKCTTGVWAPKGDYISADGGGVVGNPCPCCADSEVIVGSRKYKIDGDDCSCYVAGNTATWTTVPPGAPALPPCGSPHDCCGNECDDIYGDRWCAWGRIHYYEWECA